MIQDNVPSINNPTLIREDVSFPHLVGVLMYDMFIGILVYHFLAVFGLILSLILPLTWIFYPNATFCVVCLHQRLINKQDPYCPTCHRKVDSIYHPTFKSILITTLVILILSNISMFFFVLESKYLFKFDIPKYILSLNSDETQHTAEMSVEQQFVDANKNTVTFDVIINTDAAINLVQSDIRFDNNVFKVKEIQVDKSFATIFTQKLYSDNSDVINLVGGLPNPGFKGRGLFARIVLERKALGSSQIEFLSSSRVLANDGNANNLLLKTIDTTIEIR
jgi:hypothetical protein